MGLEYVILTKFWLTEGCVPLVTNLLLKVNLYNKTSSYKAETPVSLSMYKGDSKYLVGKKLHKEELQFPGMKVLFL